MKIEVECQNKEERRAIEAALADPAVRAYVLTVGLLIPLSQRARQRVINYLVDVVNDPDFPSQESLT